LGHRLFITKNLRDLDQIHFISFISLKLINYPQTLFKSFIKFQIVFTTPLIIFFLQGLIRLLIFVFLLVKFILNSQWLAVSYNPIFVLLVLQKIRCQKNFRFIIQAKLRKANF
jgi:hypothetical protein